MERLCPQIDQLVSCYTCGDQTLPPYRLCANAHVCCPPCVQHLPRCRCGHQFTCDPQTSFDWLVLAMKLRCKHRGTPAGVGGGDEVVGDGTTGCNDQRWYGVQELREHYRSGCARNAFTCPLTGCGHVARVETIVEHYETAHGPIEELKPADRQRPYEVTLKIPSWWVILVTQLWIRARGIIIWPRYDDDPFRLVMIRSPYEKGKTRSINFFLFFRSLFTYLHNARI